MREIPLEAIIFVMKIILIRIFIKNSQNTVHFSEQMNDYTSDDFLKRLEIKDF